MRFYIAYGSNLSVEQMAFRCPDAHYVGYTTLEGYRLLFRGSGSGNYLTIEKMEGRSVPAIVWEVSESDESSLDHYEGLPDHYHKETMNIELFSLEDRSLIKEIEAFVYIMNIRKPLGHPTEEYYSRCLGGYQHFGFDPKILEQAYDESIPDF